MQLAREAAHCFTPHPSPLIPNTAPSPLSFCSQESGFDSFLIPNRWFGKTFLALSVMFLLDALIEF